jgi:hypothetical protein
MTKSEMIAAFEIELANAEDTRAEILSRAAAGPCGQTNSYWAKAAIVAQDRAASLRARAEYFGKSGGFTSKVKGATADQKARIEAILAETE